MPEANFAAQSEALAGIYVLEQYTDWMKGLLGILPDGRFEIKSFATDEQRQNVAVYGVFSGTHTRGRAAQCRRRAKKRAPTMYT